MEDNRMSEADRKEIRAHIRTLAKLIRATAKDGNEAADMLLEAFDEQPENPAE